MIAKVRCELYLQFYLLGLEEVRVLVRGNLLRAVRGVRAGVQPDLGADPHLAGDEETHLQPAAGGPHDLRDVVSFCTSAVGSTTGFHNHGEGPY